MKERKQNAYSSKAIWWYDNCPGGPIPKQKRNYPRDCRSIKLGFPGIDQEWQDLCVLGWNHADARIRHYCRLRVTSFVALIPELIKASTPTAEEAAEKVKLVKKLTESFGQKKPEWVRDEVNGGWKRS